jgi:hypothetical protein
MTTRSTYRFFTDLVVVVVDDDDDDKDDLMTVNGYVEFNALSPYCI